MAPAIQALAKRLASADSPLTKNEKLVLRLNVQGLANAGILSAFFLNLITLKPNQVSQTPDGRVCSALSKTLHVADYKKLGQFANL